MVVGLKRNLYEVGEYEVQKKSRCEYFTTPFDGTSSSSHAPNHSPLRTRGPIRSASFVENIRLLTEEFPDVPAGILTSMLETSDNDIAYARSLVIQICNMPVHTPETGNQTDTSIQGRKRHLDTERSPDSVENDENSPVTARHANVIEEWTTSAIRGLHGATDMVEAHARLRPRVQALVREITTSSASSDEGTFRNSKRREGQSILVDPTEYENLRRKAAQYSSNQQILARAVKAQHEKILCLEHSMAVKDKELSCLTDELKDVGGQLRKAREATATLQYYLSSQDQAQMTDFVHRRGPDIF